MTLQEPKQTPEIPTESKYANDFKFWRTGTEFYLLIQIQIAIINLQTWCLEWQISINISKTNYITFYDKKTLPPPPIPVTINRSSLTKLKAKRVLGIIIDEDLTFTPHIEHITQKWKIAYNRLTLYSTLSSHLALELSKAFIRSKLEFSCTVWFFFFCFFLVGIHPMQGWTATARHGVTRKEAQKGLQDIEDLFRKNPQLKDVC